MLATHMTGDVTASAGLTVGLVVLATVLWVVSAHALGSARSTRRRELTSIVCLAVGIAGTALSAVNTFQLRHVHVCHQHNLDSCGGGHYGPPGQKFDHTHWLGRWW